MVHQGFEFNWNLIIWQSWLTLLRTGKYRKKGGKIDLLLRMNQGEPLTYGFAEPSPFLSSIFFLRAARSTFRRNSLIAHNPLPYHVVIVQKFQPGDSRLGHKEIFTGACQVAWSVAAFAQWTGLGWYVSITVSPSTRLVWPRCICQSGRMEMRADPPSFVYFAEPTCFWLALHETKTRGTRTSCCRSHVKKFQPYVDVSVNHDYINHMLIG